MEHDHPYSDSYAEERHYEPETTHEEAAEEPQETDPQHQQQNNNKQRYQSRSPPPSSQPAQNQYANPKYPPQSPSHYPPQASPPSHYPPQANYQHPPQPAPGYFPAQQPMQANPQTYQPQQQAYTAQPRSPYNPGPAAPQPTYHGNGAAPGYVVQQPPYQPAYAKKEGTVGWTTGLFDCMDDPTNALITACFPCVTFGQVAEIVDNGHTTCATSGILYGCIAFLIGVPCLISCGYRSKLRSQYDLIETPAADWLTHCFCEWCALCQEYRELKNKGFDPSIGWHGNMMRNQQAPQVAMMPPANQTMAGPNMSR
ncbi:Plant cadmium resistance [Thalictrum thalictroides]|uniref:Plant cadmium resistance n=1 Tax=Thalictrum thalictroides TaxID=46969 RepID=A0A7J6VGY0_THATH|nr:Plant cadmium resistance [Thalictrum thalictroides]